MNKTHTLKIFNPDALVLVWAFDKKLCKDFVWLNEYKPTFWERFFVGRAANNTGWHYVSRYLMGSMGYEPVSEHEIVSGEYKNFGEQFSYNGIPLVVSDGKAYFRPYVELRFVGGAGQLVEFNSFEEARAYAEEIADKNINCKLVFDNN